MLQAGKIWTKSNCPNFMKLWSFGEKAWTFFKTAGDAILDIFPDVKLLANASIYLKYFSSYVCQKLWYSVMSKWTKTSSEHEIPPSRFERAPVPLSSSFAVILAKQNRGYHLRWGKGEPSKFGSRGGGCHSYIDPMVKLFPPFWKIYACYWAETYRICVSHHFPSS